MSAFDLLHSGSSRFGATHSKRMAMDSGVASLSSPLTAESGTFELPDGIQGAKMMELMENEAKLNDSSSSNPNPNSTNPNPNPNARIPYGPKNFSHPLNTAIKMAHGTTTMAFLFDAGVLVAVDSRASMGSYIGSGTVKKVIKISKFLLGTMAGGAADCSFWERRLAFRCRLHELNEGSRISVAAASKLLANFVYQYKGRGLSMGTMVAGWDDNAGPQLFYVDNDGTRLKGDRFCVGSGATYAYGVLDNEYRKDLTVPEAIEVGKRAIWHATHRDAYSGGTINVFVITKEGWTHHVSQDMNEIYYGEILPERIAEEKKRAAAADDSKMDEE